MQNTLSNLTEKMTDESLKILKRELGGKISDWSLSEIGDGNVNFIFKISGPKGQVLVKQAVPYLRCVGESWPLSLRRNFFEFEALKAHAKFAGEYVPKVFSFNESSASMIMEFLGDHQILRKGMIAGQQYPKFADHITDYMAKTLFFTSDLALKASEKKAAMKVYCDNTDLCKITEDLIFTDPFRSDARQNHWTSPQLDSLIGELQTDVDLKASAAQMKLKFLSEAQALVHGDLHSGSIMVNQNETKVIDPEFAFYGPMGFDVGLLLGNFLMSYFSQAAHSENRSQYEAWILNQVEVIWQQFSKKFSGLWDENLTGDFVSPALASGKERIQILQKIRSNYLANLFQDSLGFAACEMIRRVVGLAHVADLDSIENPDLRAKCQTRVLNMARQLLVQRTRYQNIKSVTELAQTLRTEN